MLTSSAGARPVPRRRAPHPPRGRTAASTPSRRSASAACSPTQRGCPEPAGRWAMRWSEPVGGGHEHSRGAAGGQQRLERAGPAAARRGPSPPGAPDLARAPGPGAGRRARLRQRHVPHPYAARRGVGGPARRIRSRVRTASHRHGRRPTGTGRGRGDPPSPTSTFFVPRPPAGTLGRRAIGAVGTARDGYRRVWQQERLKCWCGRASSGVWSSSAGGGCGASVARRRKRGLTAQGRRGDHAEGADRELRSAARVAVVPARQPPYAPFAVDELQVEDILGSIGSAAPVPCVPLASAPATD
jgi:hypothetical protein